MNASPALFSARLLVDELLRGGVRVACVAPGSRSTPLALAVAERSELTSHVLTDERSMGFFALGIARATREPVVVVCTSGTAVANLLPAVAEAALGGGALLLLTADRPPEQRDCGSPQTIDQVGIFGSHARWALDLPLLDVSTKSARVLRSLASRAVATAIAGDGGPVHLNVPIREPFVDDSFPAKQPLDLAARGDGRPFTRVAARAGLAAEDIRALAARLAAAKRGVIVAAGSELPAPALARLAAALGWPILADPLSGLRFGAHDRSRVVDAVEPLLRDEALRREVLPDAVLRFGLTPAPRSVQTWLDEAWAAEHVVVTAADSWPDPVHGAATIVRADAGEFCEALAGACARANDDAFSWCKRWLDLSQSSREALDRGLGAATTLFDGIVLEAVVRALPEGATLVIGNSMPVRDAEAFVGGSDKALRVLANRGASGIDGVLSTALGVAATRRAPVALVVGDLSFLHDAAALAFAARERIPLLVVVVNNDGGGIFSYLPLHDAMAADAAGKQTFERFFGTPHGADLGRVAAVAGGFFTSVDRREDLDAGLRAGLEAAASGIAVLEVRTDREAGVLAHRGIVAAAQAAATAASQVAATAASQDAATTASRDTVVASLPPKRAPRKSA